MCRCNILAHIITADVVLKSHSRSYGSVSRNSLPLIRYTSTIVCAEINFNRVESLVGKKLSFLANSMQICMTGLDSLNLVLLNRKNCGD